MVNADDELPPIGTDEDYRCIEKAAGIETPNHRFRHRLARCIERWTYYSEPDYSNVRQATFLKAVRHLKTDAEHLLRDLTYPTYNGDDQSEQAQALAYGDAVDFLGASGVLVQHLHELVEQANETLDAMPLDKGGRPPDVAFEMLIRTLANFYMNETKKKPSVTWDAYGERYSGAFFDFIAVCIRTFAPRYASKTNHALGKAIQRALKRLPPNM